MDDWVVVDDQNLFKDEDIEETTVSRSIDPSDLVVALSSSDEKEMSSQGCDYDSDEAEGYNSGDSSNYEPEMADDMFEVPVVNPRTERINRIAHLIFPRLPARTLLRFKSVSPSFNDLISSPFMVHSHFLHPKALSGFFYHNWGGVCYLSLDAPSTNLPDPSLSYLPEPVTTKASTRGLLCVRGLNTLKFYVTNPITKEWVDLPQATVNNYDIDKVAVVIVFDEPSVYNFSGDYRVVCAYPIIEGVYSFMTFSSDKWEWTMSAEICDVVKNIVAESGTAVGAVAYWRTTAFNFILSYDPVKDRLNNLQRPHYEMREVWWELGEMDGQLSVTSQLELRQILVSTMTVANNGETPSWKEMAKFWIHDAHVMPVRSQGLAKLVFLEEKINARGLVLRDMEGQQVCNFEELTGCYGFVPYISTLVPVKRPGAGMGTEPSINQDDIMLQLAVGNIGSGDEASS